MRQLVGQGELTVSGTKDMGITEDFEVIMIISIIQLAEDYERPEKPLELLRIRRILPSSFFNVETRTPCSDSIQPYTQSKNWLVSQNK